MLSALFGISVTLVRVFIEVVKFLRDLLPILDLTAMFRVVASPISNQLLEDD